MPRSLFVRPKNGTDMRFAEERRPGPAVYSRYLALRPPLPGLARPRKSRGGLSDRGGLSASLLPFLLPFLFAFLLPFLFVVLNALGRECVGARARSVVSRERALAFV